MALWTARIHLQVTLVNIPIVWFLFPACAYAADKYSDIPALLCWSVSTFNAVAAHIVIGMATTVYNPGGLQSLFMARGDIAGGGGSEAHLS